ncbi:MAG: metal-dependent hydrolase [Dictyoglomaceae bacterium]
MTSKTHQSFGLMMGQVFYPNFINIIPLQNKFYWSIGFILGIMWGALIPDIDAPHSEFSQRLISQKKLSSFLSIFLSFLISIRIFNLIDPNNLLYFFGIFILSFFILSSFLNIFIKKYFIHRGFAHTLWNLLIINIFLLFPQKIFLSLPLFASLIYNGFIWGINLGYLSHLIGDSLTFSGIRPFFPLDFKISLGLFRTNSFTERILFYFFNFMNLILLVRYITIVGGLK